MSKTIIFGHVHKPYLSRWKLCQLRKKRKKKIEQGFILHGLHIMGNHETRLEYAERRNTFDKWLQE